MKLILGILALLCLAPALKAETNAYAFETLTITTSTVVGFTDALLIRRSGIGRGGTTRAFCTTETMPVRFRVDGSSPTASVGHNVAASTSVEIYGYDNVRAARFIGSSTGSATWQCSYETGNLP